MPMLNWIVPYLIAGGVMWFVVYQMAPVGRDIPLGSALLAVFLMAVCGVASHVFLNPALGNWRMLAEVVADAVIVMTIFHFSFSRSLMAVFVYWAVMLLTMVAIAMMAKSQRRSLGLAPSSSTLVMYSCPLSVRSPFGS